MSGPRGKPADGRTRTATRVRPARAQLLLKATEWLADWLPPDPVLPLSSMMREKLAVPASDAV
jgi:hypothetical protein